MMLRRNNRKADYVPKVNGKPIEKEPKKRSLTDKQPTINYNNYSQTNKNSR